VTRGYRLQAQVDLFNAFNTVVYQAPSQLNVTNTGFGTVTTAAPARNVQLGFRFTF
jgi:hypothetical protein